jgi:hypothetical protein
MTVDPFCDIDLKTAKIEELLDRLTPLFTGLQIRAPVIKAGTKLIRARKLNKGECIENIVDVGIPPPSKIVRPSRLNDIGEQVGYFSISHRSVYFEVHPKVGDIIILSRWITKSDMIFLHVGYQSDIFSSIASSRTGAEYDWAPETRQISKHNQEVYDFLSSELTKIVPDEKEWEYKTTIAIGRKFFGNGPHDGLLYPSIAMKANADNMAIKKESLSKLRLYAIEKNQITEINGMQINYERIDSSTTWDEDGKIHWNGRGICWEVGPKQMVQAKVEDDEWVLYNDRGNEIFPI